MAGEFLPPVVTTLEGDIDPLLEKLAEARAAIKALGNVKISIPVNFEVNQASFQRAVSNAKSQAKQGVTAPLNFDTNMGSLARSMASAQAMARAGVTVPVRFDFPNMLTGFHPFRASNFAAQDFFNRMGGPSQWNVVPPGSFDNGGGGGGGFLNRMFTLGNPGDKGNYNMFFGRLGFLNNWSYAALHSGALGLAALGMGIIGSGIGLGSLASVWGSGASHAFSQGAGLFQAQQAMIPPGVPDYQLARAFGLLHAGPNSTFAVANRAGNGQVLSALGGILAMFNRNGPLGSLVARTGLNAGMGLDNLIGRMDLHAANGGALAKFFGATTNDARNLGAAFSNLGAITGHVFSHMPGEIEWLTTGMRNVTGWANSAFKTPVLKSILGDAIFGGFLVHSSGLISKLLRGGLGKVGLGGLTAEGGLLARLGTNAGLFGTTGFAGMMLNPYTLGIAAMIGTGLAAYRYQTPTSAAIRGILGNVTNVGAGEYMNWIGHAYGQLAQGAHSASNRQSFLGHVLDNVFNGNGQHPNALANFLTFGLYNKELSPQAQYAYNLQNMMGSLSNYGGGVNAVARALHISTSEAANLMAMSGVKVGKNGQIVGGNAMAVRLARNFWNANGILNGQVGEVRANMTIGSIVNDSAWKQAAKINSNWDTFMGALTGGGMGLGNLYSVLARVSPSAARRLAMPTGLIPTSQGVMSAGQPLLDFFRQAQSVGAISGKSLQQSFLQVAASMAPLAGHSKAAQAQLVALANESGLNVKSFSELMKMTGGSAAAEKNLANSIGATTVAMAKVPAGMQSAMEAVQRNVTGMAAAIISKDGSAGKAFDNLISKVKHFGATSPQAEAAGQRLANTLMHFGMNAHAADKFVESLGIDIGKLPNMKKINLYVTVTGQVAGNPAAVNYAISQGANAQTIIHARAGGHALGVRNAIAGWSWVGERGPELMRLKGGEDIIPAHRVNQQLANASSAGFSGDLHNHIYIDGREVLGVVKQQTWQYNVNNGNRDKQGRVNGTLRPRY